MNIKSLVLFFLLLIGGAISANAQEVSSLVQKGHSFLLENKTDSAVACFENVLTLEPKNYDALTFLCNFYYQSGLKVLDKFETAYLVHESPTRMQVAQYNEDLKRIYSVYISKAESLLVQAYLVRKNDYLDELAGQIADYKERIGIRKPSSKKVGIKRTKLP